MAAITRTIGATLILFAGACDGPQHRARPLGDGNRTDDSAPTRSFSCTQLDIAGDGTIDFADFLLVSNHFGDMTQDELPMDFALFLELSDRFGEECDGLLKAPLAYSSMEEILEGRIDTIYGVVDRLPWSDQAKEDYFADGQPLDALPIDGPVAMPNGSVRFDDLATVDEAWAYAVRYGESGPALQLRWLESMVAFGLYRDSDAVHQALAEAYLEAEADPDGDAFRSAGTCQATCNLGYAVSEDSTSAKRKTTCNSLVDPELPVTLENMQTSCEAGYGLHTEIIDGNEWQILGPYGQTGMDIVRTECHKKTEVAMICSFVGDCSVELCEAEVSSSGLTYFNDQAYNDQGVPDLDNGASRGSVITQAQAQATVVGIPASATSTATRYIEGRAEALDGGCTYTESLPPGYGFVASLFSPVLSTLGKHPEVGFPMKAVTVIADFAGKQAIEAAGDPSNVNDAATCISTNDSQTEHAAYNGAVAWGNLPFACPGEGAQCPLGHSCNATTEFCEPSECNPSTVSPDCGTAEQVDEHGIGCAGGRCFVPGVTDGSAKLLMGPRRPVRRVHTLEASTHAFSMSLMPTEEAAPCCAIEGEAKGTVGVRAATGSQWHSIAALTGGPGFSCQPSIITEEDYANVVGYGWDQWTDPGGIGTFDVSCQGLDPIGDVDEYTYEDYCDDLDPDRDIGICDAGAGSF